VIRLEKSTGQSPDHKVVNLAKNPGYQEFLVPQPHAPGRASFQSAEASAQGFYKNIRFLTKYVVLRIELALLKTTIP
jgi:hypothetical protein